MWLWDRLKYLSNVLEDLHTLVMVNIVLIFSNEHKNLCYRNNLKVAINITYDYSIDSYLNTVLNKLFYAMER